MAKAVSSGMCIEGAAERFSKCSSGTGQSHHSFYCRRSNVHERGHALTSQERTREVAIPRNATNFGNHQAVRTGTPLLGAKRSDIAPQAVLVTPHLVEKRLP